MASFIFCFITPSITITAKHTITICLIKSLLICLIPLSKLVSLFFVVTLFPTLPKYVSNPVFITTPVPKPDTTEEPINATLGISNISWYGLEQSLTFSTKTLSPVNTA